VESRGRPSPRRGVQLPSRAGASGSRDLRWALPRVSSATKSGDRPAEERATLGCRGTIFVAGAIRVSLYFQYEGRSDDRLFASCTLPAHRAVRLLPTGLPNYIFGFLVLPESSETAVTQVVVRSPLYECEFRDSRNWPRAKLFQTTLVSTVHDS
jgi:hypothetical protein